MTTDPTALALKIQSYIQANPNVKYSTLEARAKGHGIESHVFESAMELVHRRVWIKKTAKGDDITYSVLITPAKPKEDPFAPIADYPAMDETNNADHAIFEGMSYDHLFLTPEEMLRFKAGLKGVAFIPRRKHEYHTRL